MSNIYARVGFNFQQIGGECPQGFILMQFERTEDTFIAKEDGTWAPAPVVIPSEVSLAQGQAILVIKGKYQSVLDYIASINDPTQKALAEIAFNKTNPWNRQSPFLNQAATDLGFASQLDDWFVEAASIVL